MVELSVVNTPANADALFTMARAVKLFFETQEKRNFGLMWMMTRSDDNTAEENTETAVQAETEEETKEDETTDNNEDTEEKEDVKTDENWDDEDDDTDEEPEKPVGNQKLTDDDFTAVEDDEDEDDEDSEDEDTDEDEELEEETKEDQEKSDNNSGDEVEKAGESPVDAEKADDENPQKEPEQRSFVSITDFMSLRNVLNELVETVSEMWAELNTLRTDNVELREQNADLINKLSSMPANKWFRTIWGLEKKKAQWTTIITTLKQAKREAWAWSDEDDDE